MCPAMTRSTSGGLRFTAIIPPLYYPSFGFGFGIGLQSASVLGGWGGWGYWGWARAGSATRFSQHYFFHQHGFHYPYGGHYQGESGLAHDPGHRHARSIRKPPVAARFGGRSWRLPRFVPLRSEPATHGVLMQADRMALCGDVPGSG